jgi:hypothetical protein
MADQTLPAIEFVSVIAPSLFGSEEHHYSETSMRAYGLQCATAALASRDARVAELERLIRAWHPVMEEVHRRADKEWCLEERCDFTVTIEHDVYAALSQQPKEQT